MQAGRQSSLLSSLAAIALFGAVGCGISDPLLDGGVSTIGKIDGGTDAGGELDGGDADGGSDTDGGTDAGVDGGTDAGPPPFGTFAIQLSSPSPIRTDEAKFTVSDCGTAVEVLLNDGNIPESTDAAWQPCVTDEGAIIAKLETGGMHWLRAWVKDEEGQIFEVPPRLTVVRGSMFALGNFHSCSLVAGSVSCWGDNTYGQLGLDSEAPSSAVPVTVPGFESGVTEIAGGFHSDHVCALKDGRVYCWGYNYGGQLGNPQAVSSCVQGDTNGCSRKPVSVLDGEGNPIEDVVSISSGIAHVCAEKKDGSVMCWGDNSYGQLLGGVHDAPRRFAAKADALTGATTTIATLGGLFSCANTESGLVCAGLDYTNSPPDEFGAATGLLGRGSSETCPNGYQCAATPVLPLALEDAPGAVTQVTAGYFHACALADGKVRCWGANHLGQYGDGLNASEPHGVLVSLDSDANYLASGAHHTCARMPDGKLACWGLNDFGQLGSVTAAACWINNSSCSLVPLPVAGIEGVAAVSGGRSQTCAAADGKVWCWGGNTRGELGASASDICPDDLGRPQSCSRTPLAVPGLDLP
jgi:alpha-tubulin suppressor-like RCC1 family protein